MGEAKERTLNIEDVEEWFGSILEARSPPSSTIVIIHRVPMIIKEHKDHDKYFVPKVVSIGPYHHGKPNLESVQDVKPLFTNKLLEGNQESLMNLYNNLAEMVQTLKGYYTDEVDRFTDDEFTRMMLLDGCFILCFIEYFYLDHEVESLGWKSHQIMFVQQDMFLLENQIPFLVLTEVMKFVPDELWDFKIKRFVDDNKLGTERRKRGHWKTKRLRYRPVSTPLVDIDNLIHRLHDILTRASYSDGKGMLGICTRLRRYINRDPFQAPSIRVVTRPVPQETRIFHSVNDLIKTGIHFKPSSSTILADVEFVRHYWWFAADLKLPRITLDRLLNLLAFEMCSGHRHDDWVTSYVCLLRSLIEKPDDVKALRNARIIDDPLGNVNDEEVVTMFKDISVNLIPNDKVYSKLREQIQNHYDSWNSTHLTELKHDYLKSPWSLLALLGGLLILFLSSVQTYFTVWSPKSECDDLCKFLKMNHHL